MWVRYLDAMMSILSAVSQLGSCCSRPRILFIILLATSRTSAQPEDGPVFSDVKVSEVRPRDSHSQFIARSDGTLVASGATFYGLMYEIFGRELIEFSDFPEWFVQDHWSIEGRLGKPGEVVTHPQMVKALLHFLERDFDLRFHTENRKIPAFALHLAGAASGPSLRVAKLQSPPRWRAKKGRFEATNVTIADLVERLSALVEKPVVDATELTGRFDITLNLDATEVLSDPIAAVLASVEQQLGLTLRPSATSMNVLVIDSVRRPIQAR
jgi:uncharacterized protein (TIGR03435 family)